MRLGLVLIALVLGWTVMLLFGAMEFDRGLLLLFYAGDAPRLATAARWLTEIGGWRVLLPVSAAGLGLLLYRRQWRSALLLAGITLSGRWLVALQKDWTARVRPDPHDRLVEVQSLAFPSGHAANSTMVFLCLAFLVAPAGLARSVALWIAVWLSLAIGLSRLMLGVHWPSDVIGGWTFGLFWTLLLLRLSGHRLDEGTPAPLAHWPGVRGEPMNEQENRRAETSRETDDSDLIERTDEGTSHQGASGGDLQRDVASRAEADHEAGGDPGVTRVRAGDKPEEANLPRFNQS